MPVKLTVALQILRWRKHYKTRRLCDFVSGYCDAAA